MTPQPTLFITYIDSAEGMVIYDPWEQGQGEQSSALPLWQGEELSGQGLLVGKADRLADEILFANYYQDLLTKAPNPTIHCSPTLLPLLQRSFPTITFQPVAPLPSSLFPLPPPSPFPLTPPSHLPLHCFRQIPLFLEAGAYLQPDAQRRAYWQERVDGLGDGVKIGVCWMEDDGDAGGEAKLGLDAWLPLFAERGPFQYLTIQPGTLREDVERIRRETGMEVHDLGAELDIDKVISKNKDTLCRPLPLGEGWGEGAISGYNYSQKSPNLDDRAALLASCDVVISRSQLNLALAAAVGTRAWPTRTQGWSDCETTLPPLPTPWPPGPDGKTQPAMCIARFHTPWGLPQKITALEWLALEQTSVRSLSPKEQYKSNHLQYNKFLPPASLDHAGRTRQTEEGIFPQPSRLEKSPSLSAFPVCGHKKAAEQSPASPPPPVPKLQDRSRFNLSMLHAQAGNLDRALELMIREYFENPDRQDGFAQLGWIKYEATDYRGALPLLMRDYKKGRMSGEWQLKLAEALGQVGDFESAEAVVERAYQEDGRLKDGFARVASRMMAYPVKDWANAERLTYRDYKIQRLSPNWLINNIIPCRMMLSSVGEAKKIVEETYTQDQRATDGYGRIGWCGFLNGGNLDFFREMLEKDRNLNRFSAAGEKYQTYYQVVNGNIEQAVDYIVKLYTNKPMAKNLFAITACSCWKYIDARNCCDLFERDFKMNRMHSIFFSTYAIALNTMNLNGKAIKLIEYACQHRQEDDLIFIGNTLFPDAVIPCNQFKKFIKQGYGFQDLPQLKPIADLSKNTSHVQGHSHVH